MAQKLICEVEEVRDHGERVYSVFLHPSSPIPRFQAGQFLHLALDPYEPGDFWPDSRVFSIASSPAERSHLQITYAVKGSFTTRMEAELHQGKQIWVKMPYGEFTIDSGDCCLVAGGTGITAFSAFLSNLEPHYPDQVILFYGARRPDLLIYRPLVEQAAARCQSLHVVFMAEQGECPGCLPGCLSPQLVVQSHPNPAAVTYYLAGPPEMHKVFIQGLRQSGISDERIRVDAWE